MELTVNDLSPDQRSAYNEIVGWMRDPGRTVLTLGGFAGSGKSTLVSLVSSQIDLAAFCAFTGKASSVLKRKLTAAGIATVGVQPRKDGMPSLNPHPYCGTIHALIYVPCKCLVPETIETLKPCPKRGCVAETTWVHGERAHSVCAEGHEGLVKSVAAFDALKPETRFVEAETDEEGYCTHCRGKGWLRREVLDRDYNLIIVDEASMVDDTMLRDLQSYGVPILAVGDHGQLPPVGGSSSLMRAPHLRLEKIHRQAEGNPIIALSKIIRETGRLPDSLPGDAVRFERLRFVERLIEERYADASPERLLEMGLVCYTNRRRTGLNLAVRRVRGTARNRLELPHKGEHVVCLRNMKSAKGAPPIYNGMKGVLTSDALPKPIRNRFGEQHLDDNGAPKVSETQLVGTIEFPEDELAPREFEMLRAQFGRDKTFSSPEDLARETGLFSFAAAGALFDFGFAMTCHKMQGSQVDDLVVCVERPGPVSDADWVKWLYTAVTRAAAKLTVLR